uniref:Uncharacterized protein n=1 Tax=Rangifer tarandus platyrhynchus TaxID=3082113 RepID=A0ACB0DUU3_RANTA|nr:unnamed protein product [Rangifer tarandus platyrhynchus]
MESFLALVWSKCPYYPKIHVLKSNPRAVSGISRFLCVAQVLNGFRRFLCVARVLNGLCVVQVASSKLAGAHRRTWREAGAKGRG